MISTEETQRVLERRALMIAGLEVLAVKGIRGTTIELLASQMELSEDEFRKTFRDKLTFIEEVCDYFGPNTSGTSLVTNELMDELDNPHSFLKSFVLRLVKRWNSRGDRLYLKFLLSQQPIIYDDKIITLAYYMNDARSLWWMIFEEMIGHGFVKDIDPVILANEFITPLFMSRIEHQMPHNDENYQLAQDIVLSHLAFFWEKVRNDEDYEI